MANGNVHSRMLFYWGVVAEKRDDDNYRKGVSLSFPIVSCLIAAKSSSARNLGERA